MSRMQNTKTSFNIKLNIVFSGEQQKMNAGLFGVGLLSLLLGTLFLVVGFNQKVNASTNFGKFSGGIGAVLVIEGTVMMGISTMV
jgi:hypothetical protein